MEIVVTYPIRLLAENEFFWGDEGGGVRLY